MPYDEKLIAEAESFWNHYRQYRDQKFKEIGSILIKLNNDEPIYQASHGTHISLSPLMDISSNKREDIVQSVLTDMKNRNISAQRDKRNDIHRETNTGRNKYGPHNPYPQEEK